MRSGLIAKKVGMTRVFEGGDKQVPVTLLQIDNNRVVNVKTEDCDGYKAVCIGYGIKKESRMSKPQLGLFKKNNMDPAEKTVEFRVSDDGMLNVGDVLSPDHFVKGQFVDVIGVSIGKGFQGPMKRWNFAGLEATHGVKKAHRSHGSTGTRQGGGKTFKNKKMAGHMGDERVTVQNLQIIEADLENNLLIVKGAVPGHKGSYIMIKDAVKKSLPENTPFPAGLKASNKVKAQVQAPIEEVVVEGQGE